jgi:hypothetical protein
MDFAYTFAGLAVGAVVGLTGVGGGSLMTPILVLLFGVAPATAVGTDLLYAAITKAGGVAVHGLNRTIDWKLVGLFAAGSVPASIVVILLMSGRRETGNGNLDAIFSASLGVMLLLTALSLVFRQRIREWSAHRYRALQHVLRSPLAAIPVGAFIGAAVSLSSVGAGAIGVTALMLLYPALATSRVVGTDIAHAVPLTLVAGLGHASLGHVDWMLLLSLIAGSLPGVALGSLLAARLTDLFVRRALIVLLLLTGSRLILVR